MPHFIIDCSEAITQQQAPDAIMQAVHDVTHTIHAKAIVSWTGSGSTGLRAARERPEAPIIALTPSIQTARRLCIVWGLHCVLTEDAHDLDDVVERAAEIAYREGFAKAGERIVVTAYEDTATGTMTQDGNGGRFTEVTLNPVVHIADPAKADRALALHHDANKDCFIANSVNFPVHHHPTILAG